ncbi:MAG TPA: tail fiber domain-containing protein [Alphaproteobacteria bacterium]|nr:tail fiber domain-containing protein [Alphaproteobacteria bacterium]
MRDERRRKALAKLGLAAGAAYFAPTILHLERASALTCSPHSHVVNNPPPPHCSPGPSDVRLKRDIEPVGRLASGIGLYRFRYVWSDELYVGVIAQEVEGVMPEAVLRGRDGFLRVDYARLGVPLMTWAEWQARNETRSAA